MKNPLTYILCSGFIMMLTTPLGAQAPQILQIIPANTSVEQYGKFEAVVGLTAVFTNPYDYDQISVTGIFTGPNGQSVAVDGFFMQDFEITNTQTGTINALNNGVFKIRFAPSQIGTWSYTLTCTTPAGTGTFAPQTFQCIAPTGNNKGFVRSDATNYLHFDGGEQFIPIGENLGWQQGNIYTDYKRWLDKIADNQGNFFRIWQCHWGLGIEWLNNSNGYQGLRRYKQTNGFYLDWLFDYCAQKGIYAMLCLQHHGQVSSNVNPNWSESPYNTVNGGPCSNTWDFFTNGAAKNHVKNRLRYVIARWGYARSILAWELFNEVDWTNQYEQRQTDVAAWHAEMALYLKQKDPNQHLITTSFAQYFYDPMVWNGPDIDFTQTHYYVNVPNLERVLATGVRYSLDNYGKPTLTGEFGISGSGSNLGAIDPDGIHIHNCLWGSLFAGGMGAGLSWWWDNYIDPRDLYYHFAPVASVAQSIDFRGGNFMPAASHATGVGADLSVTPSQGWGGLADTLVQIQEGGVIAPAASLGQFLYGSVWNTQFRRPPVFHVNFPQNGQFKVITSNQAGQSPQIAIWLDGQLMLQTAAQINQTYSINVPAGPHIIKVDNTGTDWITVAAYVFTGVGSALDTYALLSSDHNQLAGWVLNNSYNHVYIGANGLPSPAVGGMLHASGLNNGSYTAQWYNCMTGAMVATNTGAVVDGQLSIAIPDLQWDLAFLLTAAPLSTHQPVSDLAFKVYPNPIATGPLTLTFDLPHTGVISIALLDVSGRQVASLHQAVHLQGSLVIETGLPAGLAAGNYWVKMETAGYVGVKPIVVAVP